MFFLALSLGHAVNAQVKNSFVISDNQDFDKIKLSLKASEGQCYIEPGQQTTQTNIEQVSKDNTSPTYEEKIVARTKQINIQLDDEEASLGSSISKRMFSRQSLDDYTWKVYLSNYKPMDLDLNYAVDRKSVV